MALADWLRYSNHGVRSQPLSQKLVQAMSFLPSLGVGMNVFSGGQDATGPNRTGSHRHDYGNAGDVFFTKGGRNLDWRNQGDIPLLQEIVSRGSANGVSGWGAGEGYMQPGSVHLGFGPRAVWGRGGAGANAPGWLRSAFGGAGAGAGAVAGAEAPTTVGALLAGATDPRRAEINALAETSYGSLPSSSRKQADEQPRLLGDRRQETPNVSLETDDLAGDTNRTAPDPRPKLLQQIESSMAPLAELFNVKTIGQAGRLKAPQLPPPGRRF